MRDTHLVLQEHLHELAHVDERLGRVLDQRLSKRNGLVRLRAQHHRQDHGVVGRVANLLGVQDNLLKLSSLGKRLDDLVVRTATQVARQRKPRLDRLDHVAELLAALELRTRTRKSEG
jgi:chromosome segregation ATPase